MADVIETRLKAGVECAVLRARKKKKDRGGKCEKKTVKKAAPKPETSHRIIVCR